MNEHKDSTRLGQYYKPKKKKKELGGDRWKLGVGLHNFIYNVESLVVVGTDCNGDEFYLLEELFISFFYILIFKQIYLFNVIC